MRAIVMLMLLAIAVPCYAEDPLESLNSVEDTLRAMEMSLESQAWNGDDATNAESNSLRKELEPLTDESPGADRPALTKSSEVGDLVPVPKGLH